MYCIVIEQAVWGAKLNFMIQERSLRLVAEAPAAAGSVARAHSTSRRNSGLKARSLSFTVSASRAATAARSTAATPAVHQHVLSQR